MRVPSTFSGASFRDPAGYVFQDDGIVKRLVTSHGAADYRKLMDSGLYERLVAESLLVPHEEERIYDESGNLAILRPERIPYVSYPYEWCFGQLRDAALLTLKVQRLAMQHGMSLKDASAFNVQFRGSTPVFIDTLSFEPNEGKVWVAYNQFCRHFIAPLLLMSHVSPAVNQYWKATLDGFPLDLASSLLPKKTYLSFSALVHVHMHARFQKKYEGGDGAPESKLMPSAATDRKPALIDSLESALRGIRLSSVDTEWNHYYDSKSSHYSSTAVASKKDLVSRAISRVTPGVVYDIGGNAGEYSRLATAFGAYTVCFDLDPICVHQNYERARKENDRLLLPLLLDATNPSPDLGFALRERESTVRRGRADLVIALALLHHLRITGNVPLHRIAEFLAQLGKDLLIEYVPKADPMAQVLLRARKDTFADYTDDGFRKAFYNFFDLQDAMPVAETGRVLYLLKAR